MAGLFQYLRSTSDQHNWAQRLVDDLNKYSSATPWTDYTPAVTVGSGAITTLGAVTGRFRKVGASRVEFSVSVPITTNGTAATSIAASLPIPALNRGSIVCVGRETVSGKALTGLISAGATTVDIKDYAGAYPGANGVILVVSGSYAI